MTQQELEPSQSNQWSPLGPTLTTRAQRAVERLSQGVQGVTHETISTVGRVLHGVGVLPEVDNSPEGLYRSRLEFFESTIGARIAFMEDELGACSADFTAPDAETRERQIYDKVKSSIGFSDGIQWLKLAAEEQRPGAHVDMKDWLHGRIEDYSGLLTRLGLSPEAVQLVHIGLVVKHRAEDVASAEPVTTPDYQLAAPNDDTMRC